MSPRRPVWSTSKAVLEKVGAEGIHIAELQDVSGCWCLSHKDLSADAALSVFLP